MSDFDSASVLKSPAKNLAALMTGGEERGKLWQTDELEAIFRHQMSAAIVVDLGSFDPRTTAQLKTLSDAHGLVLKSFADLFHHPVPPVELLELVKSFAKANLDHPESALPGEIASALYYLSIAAALVRLDKRITRLSDADLARGLRWAREQVWLDDATKELLAQALEKLEASKGAGA